MCQSHSPSKTLAILGGEGGGGNDGGGGDFGGGNGEGESVPSGSSCREAAVLEREDEGVYS